MKNINYLTSILSAKLHSLVIAILAHSATVVSHQSCGMYGSPPCQFLPAPPGQTPACAQPGKTYCEHIDNYPTYLIKHLLHKWDYESKNLIVDETWDEFNAVRSHHCGTLPFYDPKLFRPQHIIGPSNLNGYNYDSPTTQANNFLGASSPPNPSAMPTAGGGYSNPFFMTKLRPSGERERIDSFSHQRNNNNNNFRSDANSDAAANVSPNNPATWFKRFVRDPGQTAFSNNTRLTSAFDMFEQRPLGRRAKRQSPGRTTLCQTTSQFVAPQAALNSHGNWMFVVNEANTARQLVKTELCTTTVCDNLCQLPNGYTSRCEQKYVQKRLAALQGNGQNLYTDTFWFPSCCVCTISNI